MIATGSYARVRSALASPVRGADCCGSRAALNHTSSASAVLIQVIAHCRHRSLMTAWCFVPEFRAPTARLTLRRLAIAIMGAATLVLAACTESATTVTTLPSPASLAEEADPASSSASGVATDSSNPVDPSSDGSGESEAPDEVRWTLRNDAGDVADIGIWWWTPQPATRPSQGADFINSYCGDALARAGITLERVVAVTVVVFEEVTYPLDVRAELALGNGVYTVDSSSDRVTAHRADAVWMERVGQSECDVDPAGGYSSRAYELKAEEGLKWLWTGWLLFPGVTPKDPEGANSPAHRVAFKFDQVQLGGQAVEVSDVSGTSALTCGTATGLFAVDVTAARAAGCLTGVADSVTSADLSGVWNGTCTCNQGLTRLRLTLTPTGDTTLTGTFEFSADPSNPSVKSGSYRMDGSISSEGEVSLTPSEWIKQPEGYNPVGLTAFAYQDAPGEISTLSGSITSSSCGTLKVNRS